MRTERYRSGMAPAPQDRRPTVEQEIDQRLAKAGLRWTKGRRAVVEAMGRSTAPMSVPELQSAVGPGVPLSSLYRIITDLLEAKVLLKLEFAEGFARFELDEELASHHHHLVCTSCGQVADLELADLEVTLGASVKSIRRRTGFRATAHRLDFFGLCAACA